MPDNCPILEAHGVKLNDKRRGAEICRNCSLEKCIYDEKRDRPSKELRDREIVRLFIPERGKVKELALMFDVTRQTVHSVLKDYQLQRKRV